MAQMFFFSLYQAIKQYLHMGVSDLPECSILVKKKHISTDLSKNYMYSNI